MDGRAAKDSTRRGVRKGAMKRDHVILHLRGHRIVTCIVAGMIIAGISAAIGGYMIPIPSFDDGVTTQGVPFRNEIPLLMAVLTSSLIGGPLEEMELLAGNHLWRLRWQVIVLVLLLFSGVTCVTETIAVDLDSGVVFVRSLLLWAGMAFASGRLFGVNLSWILPLISTFPVVWFSNASWWDWTTSPAQDPFAWTSATVAVLGGIAALWLTPWRVRSIRPPWRRA